ncbi:cell adhesion molecule 3 [Mytilus galloprovincialis]|uniref:Cell adhesion molecule 3 n=1 Tax=Mytilus galloprovincialis TaxID=29158 RepID=A0A8B6GSV9_MYTGA|nr:cell adhesion molecule 3 [Mytilus galloprovincialis]
MTAFYRANVYHSCSRQHRSQPKLNNIKIIFSWDRNDVTEVFKRLSRKPVLVSDADMELIEAFVVVMYDRTTTTFDINESRLELFARKRRQFDTIRPTRAALLDHTKLATYRGGHVWGQAVTHDQNLPSPVKPLAPVFDRDPVILKETESLKISCTSTGSRPAALFNWFIGNKNITFYSTQTFAYEVTTDTWTITSVLTYTVVRQNNGQSITCIASNEADPIGISDSQWIQVQYAPKIYVNNMTFNQLENLRVISCIASGNPSIYTYYQWKHTSANGKLIREMKGNRNGELELPLSDSYDSYQDNGIYVCKAGNGIQDKNGTIEQTGYGFVTINAQPVFMSSIKGVNKSTMHGEIGRAVELTAKVYSIPKYDSVTWYRGINKELQIIHSQKYSLSETAVIVKGYFYDTEVDLDGFILTLKVNNLTTDDFTTYTVQLENNVGSPAEYVVTLEHLGRCKLEKKPDSKTKTESDIHFYQNQEFATRENREPKYEDLNLRADCQDQHTTYDSLKNDKSAVMQNGINSVTKMGGAKSKLNIDESHGEYVNQGGYYLNVL